MTNWRRALLPAAGALLLLAACNNNPLPDDIAASNTLVSAFREKSPRHLDPTASYWNNETPYTFNIYEPPYGYHYLKRPYQLVPKAAVEVVKPRYIDKNGRDLPEDAPGEQVAESVYDIRIKPGILFQPHPAFAKDAQGRFLYHTDHAMTAGELGPRRSPWEFPVQASRELVAEDYVYAMKRQATTRIIAPIYGIFSEYIVGLKDYGKVIKAEDAKLRAGLNRASLDKPFLDFRRWPLAGATAPEKHLLRLRVTGKYPQWSYWMTLTFTAPVPWEADAFYSQPGMAGNGLSLDIWPVGTGPYMLKEYVQDRRHVLVRNPNYRGNPYPCEGMPGDAEAGLLKDCGRMGPFIERAIFLVEKEMLPVKAKFRQGYYDVPEIERTEYGVDFRVDMEDSDSVKHEFEQKGIRLPKTVDLSSWIIGFNMNDPVIGRGDTPEQQARNRKLRQAISIAIDWEEFVRIFPEEGGEAAQGPLPAGLFGSRHGTLDGLNPVTHRVVDGKIVRRPIEDGRKLLAEAGYPGGRNAKSGQPLVLNYDFYSAPTPKRKAQFDWMIRQYAKLGVQLEIRATDNNQFQDKVRKGKHQIYWSGWLADYPDAENFLFLMYGPNGKTKFDGENVSNYENPEYDKLFRQLKLLDDGPAKQKLIDTMVTLLQQDAPWAWGYFPFAGGAYQSWLNNGKPSIMIKDLLLYYRIDSAERVARQHEWNRPVWWPLVAGLLAIVAVLVLGMRAFRRRERMNARGEVLA